VNQSADKCADLIEMTMTTTVNFIDSAAGHVTFLSSATTSRRNFLVPHWEYYFVLRPYLHDTKDLS
jgi:hypothetical protein